MHPPGDRSFEEAATSEGTIRAHARPPAKDAPVSKRARMAAPADEEVLAAVLAVKSAHPDYGLARLRTHIKDANGWELSEKRVKQALAAAADGGAGGAHAAGAARAEGAEGSPCGDGQPPAAAWLGERPTPRGYFSLTVVQPGDGATAAGVVMFGGEVFDNSNNTFYNQLFLLDIPTR